jgi:hypothetical protein
MATVTVTDRATRACWIWDRSCRFQALAERAEDYIDRLSRERCDVPRWDYPTRARIDRRLHVLRERRLRFLSRARVLRRAARVLDAHAATGHD